MITYDVRRKQLHQRISFSVYPFLCLVVYGVSGYNGVLKNYLSIVLLFAWYLFAYDENPRVFLRTFTRKSNIAFMLFLGFYFLTSLFNVNNYYMFSNIGVFFLIFSTLLYFPYYAELQNQRNIRLIFWGGIVTWSFFCIKALIFYLANSGAARFLVGNSRFYENIAIGGGYNIAYGSALIAVFLLDAIICRNIVLSRNRKISLIGTVLLSLLVFKTESTLTIAAMCAGFVISFFKFFYIDDKNRLLKAFLGTIILTLISLYLVINVNLIGKSMMNTSSNRLDNAVWQRIYLVGERMSNIGNDEAKETTVAFGDDVAARKNTLQRSLDGFTQSPLIGNGYKYGNVFLDGENYGVGNHSEWLDTLARYGLIGGIPYLFVYIFAIRENMKRRSIKFNAYIPVLVCMGMFNPFITYQSFFALFFLIPIISYLL